MLYKLLLAAMMLDTMGSANQASGFSCVLKVHVAVSSWLGRVQRKLYAGSALAQGCAIAPWQHSCQTPSRTRVSGVAEESDRI